MNTYEITIQRTQIMEHTFKIRATNQFEAISHAMRNSGDFDYHNARSLEPSTEITNIVKLSKDSSD